MDNFIEISIITAAARCGIHLKYTGRVEIPVICPFCGDDREHASINTNKNQFHCFKCGEGHNSITLYAKLAGMDTKTAYHELTETVYTNSRYAPPKQHERAPKPLHERHAVYTAFLHMLSLSDKHNDSLLQRGLDASAVKRNAYKSVPDITETPRIAEALSEKYDLSGIPGFYTIDGKWRISLKPGIFIPARDIDGSIQGLMIRLDNAKTHKYEWFTSRRKQSGTGANAWIHIADRHAAEIVYITEGALKSDVAAYFNPDVCYIGLPGVHCQNGIISALEQMDVKTVVEAFDMDKTTNVNVACAAAELKRKLSNEGISCQSLTWDPRFNGIDEYYQFCSWLNSAA